MNSFFMGIMLLLNVIRALLPMLLLNKKIRSLDKTKTTFDSAKVFAELTQPGEGFHLYAWPQWDVDLSIDALKGAVSGVKAGCFITIATSLQPNVLEAVLPLISAGVSVVILKTTCEDKCLIIDQFTPLENKFICYTTKRPEVSFVNSPNVRNGLRQFINKDDGSLFRLILSGNKLTKQIIFEDNLQALTVTAPPAEAQAVAPPAPVKSESEQIRYAIFNEDVVTLRHIYHNGFNINQQIERRKAVPSTAIEYSIFKNKPSACLALLELGAGVNSEIYAQYPLLSQAIHYNNIDIAELLIKKGADLNATSITGSTALAIAVQCKNTMAMALLIKYGCQVEKSLYDSIFSHTLQQTDPSSISVLKMLCVHCPVPIDTLLQDERYRLNVGITHIVINRELLKEEIEEIPAHVTTVHYISALSLESIKALKEKGKRLIYDDIKLYIDPKYMGGRMPSTSINTVQKSEQEKNVTPIFKQDNRIIEVFPLLMSLNTGNGNPLSFQDNASGEPDVFIKAASSTNRDYGPNTDVYSVFAYRKNNACLPNITSKDSRCMIVITAQEYNDLQIKEGSTLHEHYDFLVLKDRNKIDNDGKVDIVKLTERRRAAITYANEKKLKHLIMLDDNVITVAYPNSGNTSTLSQKDELFSLLKEQMKQLNEPLVSISTFSNLNKVIKKDQMGCKLWLMDLEKIRQKLPGESMSALLPYNETLWGEDYYLQTLLHVLFFNEAQNIHGYRIIDADIMQLQRLASQKSTNARQGMRIQNYQQEDVLPTALIKKISNKFIGLYSKIEKARVVFNDLIAREVERYKKHLLMFQSMDLDAIKMRGLPPFPLRLIINDNVASNESTSSNQALPLTVTQKLEHLTQQEHALYLNEGGDLMYVNKKNNCHSIVENRCPEAYDYFQKVLSCQQARNKSEQMEYRYIAALVNSRPSAIHPSFDYLPDLITALDEIFGHEGKISVSAFGKDVVLKPHQNRALAWFREQIANTHNNQLIIKMATGTGKTPIMLLIALASLKAAPNENICLIFPSIQLVHQTLEKLLNDFRPLMIYFGITEEDLYGVCSESAADIPNNMIIQAAHIKDVSSLQTKGHLFMFCDVSFKQTDANWLKNNMKLVLVDESHKQRTLIKEHLSTDTLQCFFSATPREPVDNLAVTFEYSRQEGIEDGVLTPLFVDDTLPEDATEDELMHCLAHQSHPNGGKLTEHKGLIYTNSIEEADALTNRLKQRNLFSENELFTFHSRDNNKDALQQFKQNKKGVAIAVRMLVEGFDNASLDYVIPFKNTLSNDDLHQIIGRVIRPDENNPQKVGYAIIRKSYKSETPHAETTCYPINAQERLDEHTAVTQPVEQTIREMRNEELLMDIDEGLLADVAMEILNDEESSLKRGRTPDDVQVEPSAKSMRRDYVPGLSFFSNNSLPCSPDLGNDAAQESSRTIEQSCSKSLSASSFLDGANPGL